MIGGTEPRKRGRMIEVLSEPMPSPTIRPLSDSEMRDERLRQQAMAEPLAGIHPQAGLCGLIERRAAAQRRRDAMMLQRQREDDLT